MPVNYIIVMRTYKENYSEVIEHEVKSSFTKQNLKSTNIALVKLQFNVMIIASNLSFDMDHSRSLLEIHSTTSHDHQPWQRE